MKAIENQPSVNTKLKCATNTGYTGLSLLHRLHVLYGFDPLKDLVRDIMHLIPMNCVKKIITRLIDDQLIDIGILQERINSFPFPQGMKLGFHFLF